MRELRPEQLMRVETELDLSDISTEAFPCDICKSETVVVRRDFEQYGPKINTVAKNFPELVCTRDGLTFGIPEAILIYKEWELSVRRQYKERGVIGLVLQEIENCRKHIHDFSVSP